MTVEASATAGEVPGNTAASIIAGGDASAGGDTGGNSKAGGHGQEAASGALANWAADLSEDHQALVKANGWGAIGDVLSNFHELQKFLGADKAGRGIVVPKDEGDADAWGAVYDRLGRPKDAAGYGLAERENVNPEFAAGMGQAMYEAGLSKNQAQKLAEQFEKLQIDIVGNEDQSWMKASEEELNSTLSAWGSNKDTNIMKVNQGAQFLGLNKEEITLIERSVGTKKVLDLLLKTGAGLGEDQLPIDRSNTPNKQEHLNAIINDKDLMRKAADGDKAAKDKLEQAYKAYYSQK